MGFNLETKLDRIIELLEINNKLMYMALGAEDSDGKIKCPTCNQSVIPDQLGYCPNCKNDLAQAGLVEFPKKD